MFESGALYANFPKNHALYAGSDIGPALADADVVVVLEAGVPWTPNRHQPAEGCQVIDIGDDPLFSSYPVRGFRVDLNLAGTPRLVLQALVDDINEIGVDAPAVQKRTAEWQRRNDEMRANWQRQATAASDQTPISKSWFTRRLSDVLGNDTVVLNELGIDAVQIDIKRPGSFFGVPVSGGLGWGIGAALGAKLADRDRTVICCVGDGSYIFGSGTAGHIVSEAQGQPILTIVWNNGIWNAVQSATRGTYADGYAVQTNNFAVTTLSQSFQYELICQAAGGYGERVEDPADVPAALERALNAVRHEKRQALLNVIGQ